jgi:hypothetical protein
MEADHTTVVRKEEYTLVDPLSNRLFRNALVPVCPYENNVSLLICDQVTRHDIKDKSVLGTMSEAYPHLILNNFSTKVFTSACCILKNHVFFFAPYP